MGNRVTTPNLRFEFVNGWLTGGTDPADGSVECGDGTAFPMLVTSEQLAEIMYRVRDAQFTTGGTIYDNGVSPPRPIMQLHGTPDTAQLVNHATFGMHGGYIHSERGYFTTDTIPDPDPNATYNAMFGAAYSAAGANVRDVGNNERALWIPPETVSLGGTVAGTTPTGSFWTILKSGFRCGFSHMTAFDGIMVGAPSTYCFTNSPYVAGYFEWCQVDVRFSGSVAWTGGVDPLDPASSLYVGVTMRAGVESFWPLSTIQDDALYAGTCNTDSGAKFRLVMSSDNESAECTLYRPAGSGRTTSDFELTATKWWPYAKDNPAVPVWGIGNGAKL
jgi:hypothetical protein